MLSPRKLLILLAPLAAVLGVFLSYRESTVSRLGLAVTRSEVVQLARTQAAAKGVRTDGWRDMVDLRPDNTLRHYLARTATPAEREAVTRVLAQIPYRCLLVHPQRAEDSVRITVAPDGRLITDRVPPAGRASATEAEARAAAEAELARRLGAERAGFAFAGAGAKQHDATSSTVRHFTYKKQYAPELAIQATVGTSGATVIEFSVTPVIAPNYKDRFPEFGKLLTVVRGTVIVVLIIAGLIYVIARFVRRLREHEIPLKRALIVSVFVFFAFLGSTSVGGITQQMDAVERGVSTPAAAQFTMLLVVSAIMGSLIGLTWGACEADLREAYPEKLTSIDALLGGRFSSRAVRSSVAVGLAVGAYATLISGIEPLLRVSRSWMAVAEGIGPYQTTWPALALVLFAFVGLPITLTLLLTAVSATHRNGATRNARIALTLVVLAFFLLSMLGNQSPIVWSAVMAAMAAATLLVPFFLGDLVALFVSVAFTLWLTGSAALIAQPSPSLRAGGWAVLAGVIVVVGAGSLAALRKRDEPEAVETDRPEYARNSAERIMLRSEMDAARQAQLRVMPRVVPVVVKSLIFP